MTTLPSRIQSLDVPALVQAIATKTGFRPGQVRSMVQRLPGLVTDARCTAENSCDLTGMPTTEQRVLIASLHRRGGVDDICINGLSALVLTPQEMADGMRLWTTVRNTTPRQSYVELSIENRRHVHVRTARAA